MKKSLIFLTLVLSMAAGCRSRDIETKATHSEISSTYIERDTLRRLLTVEIDSIVLTDTLRRVVASGVRVGSDLRRSREVESTMSASRVDTLYIETGAKADPGSRKYSYKGVLLLLLFLAVYLLATVSRGRQGP